jgi:uncharacterized Fe-S center protein
MKSRVYFIAVNEQDASRTIELKLLRLLEAGTIIDFISHGDNVAVKMHFGEEGNTGYVHPQYLRIICDAINARGASPYLADTNTLYHGKRLNSKDHLKLAYEHGFTADAVAAPVVIPDDTKKKNVAELKIGRRFIKTAKVLKIFLEADAIVGVAHFKGHLMTGFGGALKNIGMGCAAREGKLAQHCDISPVVILKNCTGCRECVKVCPVNAISMRQEKSSIDNTKCIGCASCIAACHFGAIEVNWAAGGESIQEKMIEYALAVLSGKEKKRVFINFALKITKECDCLAKDDPRISPDVGILLSTDTVSIDKASLDLIIKTCGRDIFKEAHPERDGNKQLRYANELGLGSLEYELVEVV